MWSRRGISSAHSFRMSRSVLWTLRASQDCLSTDDMPRPEVVRSYRLCKEDNDVVEAGHIVRAQFPHEPKRPVDASCEPGLFEHG